MKLAACLATLTLVTAPLVSCGGGGSSATPDGAVLSSIKALKKNDVESFLKSSVSASGWDEMKAEWEKKRKEPISDAEKKQFEEMMGKLTAKGATDTIYAEISPDLAEMQQQWTMMTGMLPMLAGGLKGQSEQGAAQAQSLLTALAPKLAQIKIDDEAKAREAIEVVTKAARKLDLETLADLQKLDLSGALGKADVLLASVKDVLGVYDMSLDEALDSAEVKVLEENESAAKVEVSYDLFGSPQTATVEMVLVDGNWVPKS